MLKVCCRKRLTRLLKTVALGKIARGYPERLVGAPGDGEVMAREQPSVAQHERWWTEASCGQKYRISVSWECHGSSTSGGKQSMGPVSVLLCAVGLPSANIVLTEPAVRFASVEQIQNTDLSGRQVPTLHKHFCKSQKAFLHLQALKYLRKSCPLCLALPLYKTERNLPP